MTINRINTIELQDECFRTFAKLGDDNDMVGLTVDGEYVVGGKDVKVDFVKNEAIAIAKAMLELAEKL